MPGDRVDVLLTRDLPTAPKTDGQTQHLLVTGVVVQNVRVLAIDQNANPTTTAPIVARAATLEVAMKDAERLALAAQSGSLSLALRKTGELAIEPARGFHLADLGDGGPRSPELAAADASRRGAKKAGPVKHVEDGPSMVIVNGDTATTVKVPTEGRL
jgi:pilus assembly protein CpaB